MCNRKNLQYISTTHAHTFMAVPIYAHIDVRQLNSYKIKETKETLIRLSSMPRHLAFDISINIVNPSLWKEQSNSYRLTMHKTDDLLFFVTQTTETVLICMRVGCRYKCVNVRACMCKCVRACKYACNWDIQESCGVLTRLENQSLKVRMNSVCSDEFSPYQHWMWT